MGIFPMDSVTYSHHPDDLSDLTTAPTTFIDVPLHLLPPSSTTPPFSWTWDKSLKLLALSPIVVFTILGNFLVLYAFLTRKRELRSPTHFFVANLSLADFLVGILVLPFLASVHVTDRWYFGQGFCYSWVIIHFWLCSASILSTTAVCVERYLGVRYPLKHLNIMNTQRVRGMIITVWIIAGVLTITSVVAFPEPPRSYGKYECTVNGQLGHVLIATIGILYIPTIIMALLYWRIYEIATMHLKAMKQTYNDKNGRYNLKIVCEIPLKSVSIPSSSEESGLGSSSGSDDGQSGSQSDHSDSTPPPIRIPAISSTVASAKNAKDANSVAKSPNSAKTPKASNSNSNSNSSSDISFTTATTTTSTANSFNRTTNGTKNKQINLAKRLAILVGVLLLSYIPFFTAFLIRALDRDAVSDTVFKILGWIRYFNSCLNPVIYGYAVPAYRKAFKSILTNCFRKFRA